MKAGKSTDYEDAASSSKDGATSSSKDGATSSSKDGAASPSKDGAATTDQVIDSTAVVVSADSVSGSVRSARAVAVAEDGGRTSPVVSEGSWIGETGCMGSPCCNPKRSPYRFIGLFFICFLGFGKIQFVYIYNNCNMNVILIFIGIDC